MTSGIFYSTQCAYFDCHLPLVGLRPERQLQRGDNTLLSTFNADFMCICGAHFFFCILHNSIVNSFYSFRVGRIHFAVHCTGLFFLRVFIFYLSSSQSAAFARNHYGLEYSKFRNQLLGSFPNIVTIPACSFKRWLTHIHTRAWNGLTGQKKRVTNARCKFTYQMDLCEIMRQNDRIDSAQFDICCWLCVRVAYSLSPFHTNTQYPSRNCIQNATR